MDSLRARNDPKKPSTINSLGVGAGIAIGVGVGAAIGVAMKNIGAGIAIGVAIGAAIGIGGGVALESEQRLRRRMINRADRKD